MSAGPLAGRRLLIVEDEMLLMMMMEAMLEELGCEALDTASTVEHAVELIEARAFDAATLDVNLNGRTSYPVAEALSARGIPFVFATGYGHHMRDGYKDRPVLHKPFRFQDLTSVLADLLPPASPGDSSSNV